LVNHASTPTTQFHDPKRQELSFEEAERFRV
jgi:hypothetical protein